MNIGCGWGLDASPIRVVNDREKIQLGRFQLMPIESRNFQFPDPEMHERALGDPDITEPLVPPVAVFDYKVGKAYSLHVTHPHGSWLVQGSAGYVEGSLEGLKADVVFLGVGGLGSQTETYREEYWREIVERTHADRVVPIHWDSLVGPIEGPFTGKLRSMRFLSGGSKLTLEFLRRKAAANPNLEFTTLPRYDPVALF